MIHVFEPGTAKAHDPVIKAMHRMRHRAFVEQLGWEIPSATSALEIDQFDTEDALYVVLMGDEGTRFEGHCTASVRLIPTTVPHMIGELFPEYCDLQPEPIGDDIWEMTRYGCDQELIGDATQAKLARARVNLAMLEWCQTNGVKRLTWLTHQLFYGYAIQLWTSEPLGRPQRKPGQDSAYIAGVSDVDDKALKLAERIVGQLSGIACAQNPAEQSIA